jgi:hypothetical protein
MGEKTTVSSGDLGGHVAEGVTTQIGQTDTVGPRILDGPLSGQEALIDHACDHIGQGRAINAGGLYKARLGWALIGSDGGENSELALGHRAGTGLFYKEVQSHLQHPVQQVAWRSVQINQAVV